MATSHHQADKIAGRSPTGYDAPTPRLKFYNKDLDTWVNYELSLDPSEDRKSWISHSKKEMHTSPAEFREGNWTQKHWHMLTHVDTLNPNWLLNMRNSWSHKWWWDFTITGEFTHEDWAEEPTKGCVWRNTCSCRSQVRKNNLQSNYSNTKRRFIVLNNTCTDQTRTFWVLLDSSKTNGFGKYSFLDFFSDESCNWYSSLPICHSNLLSHTSLWRVKLLRLRDKKRHLGRA